MGRPHSNGGKEKLMSDEAGKPAEERGEQDVKKEVKRAESALTKEDIEKMIQSASDRVRTEYSQKLKAVEAEKEELQKEKMSEKERAAFELEQREKAIAERDATIAARELALERHEILSSLDVPPKLAKRIIGSNRAEIEADAKSYMADYAEAVAAGVDKKLVSNTESPEMGDRVAPISRGDIDDIAVWKKRVWDLPPGPEQDKARAALFAAGNTQ